MTEPTELTPEGLDRLEAELNEQPVGPCTLDMAPMRALVAGYRQMLAARADVAAAIGWDKAEPWASALAQIRGGELAREQLAQAEAQRDMLREIVESDQDDSAIWKQRAETAEAEAQAMVDAIWDVHRECHECQSKDAYCPAHDRPALRAVARERRLAGLDVEPTISLMWAHYALVRKSTAGGREWTLHHFEEWKKRAEAAEADCAAIMKRLRSIPPRKSVTSGGYGGEYEYERKYCVFCNEQNLSEHQPHKPDCILASPNPGAGLLAEHAADVERLEGERDGFAADYDHALAEREQARKRIAELEAAVVWMTGSPDFGPEGQAREGFEKIVRPLLAALEAKP